MERFLSLMSYQSWLAVMESIRRNVEHGTSDQCTITSLVILYDER